MKLYIYILAETGSSKVNRIDHAFPAFGISTSKHIYACSS